MHWYYRFRPDFFYRSLVSHNTGSDNHYGNHKIPHSYLEQVIRRCHTDQSPENKRNMGPVQDPPAYADDITASRMYDPFTTGKNQIMRAAAVTDPMTIMRDLNSAASTSNAPSFCRRELLSEMV